MSASDKKKLRKEQNAAALTERQLKEQKETKKLKAYTLTFIVVMVLVVAIVIGVAVRNPVESVVNQNTHAMTFGEHELTTADFSFYYVDAINTYYNEVYENYYETFGSYWQMFLVFNTYQSLNDQIYSSETGTTWAQHFVDEAIKSATTVYALYDEAINNKHQLTESEQESLDAFDQNLEDLADYYEYSSAQDYLRAFYGNGATVENYRNYTTINAVASSYLTSVSESVQAEYTDDDLRDYEKDKYLNYSKFDYSYYLIKVSSYLGEGTTGEDGTVTYTEQQKQEALAAAQKDAEILKNAGITSVEKFDKIIQTLSINADNTSAACTQVDDTFYENLVLNDLGKEWVSDDDRKPGDFDVLTVMSETGEGDDATEEIASYLVILFEERDDCNINLVTIRHMLAEFVYYYDADGNKIKDETSMSQIKEKAEGWLTEWKEGEATEESFAELANKYSADGDGTTGGLYEDVFPGATVEGFNDWCFEADRQPGDTGVVESEYGYHVMYFVGTQDKTYRDLMIEADLLTEDMENWMDELESKLKVEQVNLRGLDWDFIVS